MMDFKKPLIFLTLFFSGAEAYAAKYYPKGAIESIQASHVSQGYDGMLIKIDGSENSSTSCPKGTDDIPYLSIAQDDDGKTMQSIALAAMMSGKEVEAKYDEAKTDSAGYCYLLSLLIK